MKKTFLFIAALGVALGSCTKPDDNWDPFNPGWEGEEETEDPVGDSDDNNPGGTDAEDANPDVDSDDVLVEDDFKAKNTLTITWSESGAVVDGTAVASSVDGGNVVIGSPTSEGKKVKIVLKGSSSNGSLKIYNGVKGVLEDESDDTRKQIFLSLEGVSLTSQSGPALNIQTGKRTFIKLSGSNTLCDSASGYSSITEGEDAKGCLFSECKTIFDGGDGTLSISGKYKHAICIDNYLVARKGTIRVLEAASDGIHVNEFVQVLGASIEVDATGEGIQCEKEEEGYFYLESGSVVVRTTGAKGHGVSAETGIVLSGGSLDVTVSGGGSKCLKTTNNVALTGGNITLCAKGAGYYDSEDKDTATSTCIKAGNIVTLSAADVTLKATGAGGKGINCYEFHSVKDSSGAEGTLQISTSGGVYSYSRDYSYAKGIRCSNLAQIEAGKITITTTGSGAEGIESKGNIVISGGETVINAYDDAINAAGTITVNDGFVWAYGSANDGIDSNCGRTGAIVINGGVVIAHAKGGAEEAFDADANNRVSFNGGVVFGTGGKQGGGGGSSSGYSCTQPTVEFQTSVSKGYFVITDASGSVVFCGYVPRSLSGSTKAGPGMGSSSAYIVVSSPLLKSGSTYKYGTVSAKPSGCSEGWPDYYFSNGSASVSTGSFSAYSGYFAVR